MAFVRLQGGRARLVTTFRRRGRVLQRTFELQADPAALRRLARRLEEAAAALETLRPSLREPARHEARKVWRFVSPFHALTLFGTPDGGAARFSGGVLETRDPDLARWLRKHPDFGVRFREQSP